MPNDDDWPDQIESDPRWEVQPEPAQDNGSGGALRTIGITLLALAIFSALLVWLLSVVPPVT